MRIKSIEKNDLKKPLILKIILLTSLITIGLLLYYYNSQNNHLSGKVLSSKNEKKLDLKKIENQGKDFLIKVSKKSEELTGYVLGEATEVYKNISDQMASKSAETINNLIYKSTIKPILNQYEKLPASQKQEIKKDICK